MISGMGSISRPSLSRNIGSDRRQSLGTRAGSERVLLARFHSLGDVILSTGIACRMQELGANVSVATASPYLPVFEGLPIAGLHTPANLPGSGDFDRVVDLQANVSSRRILRGLGPSLPFRSRPLERRWMVFWGRRRPRFPVPHTVRRYAEVAGLKDADPRDLRPHVMVTDRDRLEARSYPHALSMTDAACIGLAVGGSRKMKRWPAGRFDLLSEALASKGMATLRFLDPGGGPHGEEKGAVRAPLRPLKAILGRCSLLVTNDSGIMHLGVALGVPVVAIFGSTVPEFGFTPLGDADRVLERDLPCRPCAVHGARYCWMGHGRCLGDILAEDVLATVFDALERKGVR